MLDHLALRFALVAALVGVAHADDGAPSPTPVASLRGWRVDLTGFVQADAVLYSQASQDELDPATGEPLAQEHFGIPRASLRADAHRGAIDAELELEAFTTRATLPRPSQSPGVRLEIAQLGWHHRELVEISGGLFRIPFGAQTPSRPRERAFLELPTVARALFPGDLDAGVMVRGAYGLARWSVAAMNGAPVGDSVWKGKDPANSYDVIGRVGADVAGPYRSRFVVGLSALSGMGFHAGTPPTKDHIVWIDDNQDGQVEQGELYSVPGAPGEPSKTFHRNALGVDLAAHWCLCALGRGVAFAEVIAASNLDRGLVYADPIALGMRDIRELGVVVGVVQDVTPYARVGVRYDTYDADRDAAKQAGVTLVTTHQRFSTLAVMATARVPSLGDDAKVIAEYDRNTNPFGTGVDGTPVTRRDDRVVIRAQVGF